MSDGDLTTPETGATEAAVSETAPATGAAPAASTSEPDPFDAGADQFDRNYVERLRREAAEHRTAAKPYKDAFDGYSDEEQQVLLSLVRTLADDPKTAASDLERIVQNIKEAFPEPDESQKVADDTVGMTRAELEAYLEKRESAKTMKQAEDAAVAEINKTAKEFGYEEGSADYIKLLWLAQNKTNFNLSEAHDVMKAERQAIIDQYLESKEPGSVRTANSGQAPSTAKPTTTFDEAHEALMSRLRGTPGQ